jgi:DNA-binding GntR family transcriptional regulator
MAGSLTLVNQSLDEASPLPLYVQLADIFRSRIANGELTGRLPAEWSIAAEYGCSRDTVRRGMAILAAEGLITSVRGRGTFVTRPEDR